MNTTTSVASRPRVGILILIAIIGMAFSAYVVGSLLSDSNWNPTLLLKFGEDGDERFYGERYFDDLVLAPDNGHDGKYYFMQASDPLYLDPDVHAAYLDRPSYRAQRMLYPTVAGGLGLLDPTATAWSMIGVNILMIGFGTFMTSLLARELGISVWFGLAFALNPGVFVSAFIDTAEVFAMAFLVTSLYFVKKERILAASAMMTLSVLSRETMIVAAVGVAIYVWRRQSLSWPLGLPFIGAAAWWGYVHLRIGYLDQGFQDTAAVGFPFKGFAEAMDFWMSTPGHLGDMLAGVILMLIALLVLWRAVSRGSLLDMAAVGFSFIALFMVEAVWAAYFDSARVLAPLLTFYILMVPANEQSKEPTRRPRQETNVAA
jgi:hypothetical protein